VEPQEETSTVPDFAAIVLEFSKFVFGTLIHHGPLPVVITVLSL